MSGLVPKRILNQVNNYLKDRIEGLTYKEIAEKYNTTPDKVSKLVRGALQETAYTYQETAKEYLTLELERLDNIVQNLTPDLSSTNSRLRHSAIKLLLQVSDQRSKLLGLNKTEEFDLKALQTKANIAAHTQDLKDKSLDELKTIVAEYVVIN